MNFTAIAHEASILWALFSLLRPDAAPYLHDSADYVNACLHAGD